MMPQEIRKRIILEIDIANVIVLTTVVYVWLKCLSFVFGAF